jgi:hypothetical protein
MGLPHMDLIPFVDDIDIIAEPDQERVDSRPRPVFPIDSIVPNKVTALWHGIGAFANATGYAYQPAKRTATLTARIPTFTINYLRRRRPLVN